MICCLRYFLLVVGVSTTLVGWSQPRPNILWITIEDTSPEFIGCYGNSTARTPHIDQLAREGVRFTNAFSTGTVCSPSRTAIITGVKTYCTGTGHHRSSIPLPEDLKGFPYFLQQAGYYTTNSAKTDYNVANEPAFIKTAWNESNGKAGWWNRKPGQPFFAVFNFNASHQSNTMTNPYAQYQKSVLAQLQPEEVIADDAFEMPPYYHDSPEMRKEMARVYNSISLTDKRVGALLQRLKASGLMDITIIIFYGDHGEGIPRGKTNGISLGFRVPFVIWFPKMYEHLSPWGQQRTSDELVDFSDLAPTMISLAGGGIPKHMTGRVFMGKDRQSPPPYLILSSDRSDNGLDMVRAVTDGRYFYARNFLPYMPELRYIRYMEVGAIKKIMRADLEKGALNPLQRSLFEPRPAEYLFDTQADPWETRNLVDDKKHRSRLKPMRAALQKELIEKKDVMLLPEGTLAEISKNTTPFEYRLNASEYPVQAIYQAASLSGVRTKAALKQQVSLAASANKVVRYWAVTGLHAQPDANLMKYLPQIAGLLGDPYGPVGVTAAALLYRLNRSEQAVQVLKRYLLGENEHWALMGVNFLLYQAHQEPFVEAVQNCRLVKGRSYATKAACMDFLGRLELVPNDINHRQ